MRSVRACPKPRMSLSPFDPSAFHWKEPNNATSRLIWRAERRGADEPIRAWDLGSISTVYLSPGVVPFPRDCSASSAARAWADVCVQIGRGGSRLVHGAWMTDLAERQLEIGRAAAVAKQEQIDCRHTLSGPHTASLARCCFGLDLLLFHPFSLLSTQRIQTRLTPSTHPSSSAA